MLTNHGWNKIINPEKWSKLGNSFTKYFGDLIDFANPMFGFLASFSESACAILILLGFCTQPAAVLLSLTMLFAALYHITGTGNPESALIYFSIFTVVFASLLLRHSFCGFCSMAADRCRRRSMPRSRSLREIGAPDLLPDPIVTDHRLDQALQTVGRTQRFG